MTKLDVTKLNAIIQSRKQDIKEIFFIENNATNGDVIKAMFPSAIEDAYQPTDKVIAIRNLEGGNRKNNITPFLLDWWNAPYKAESEG